MENLKSKSLEKVFDQHVKGGIIKVHISKEASGKNESNPLTTFFRLVPYLNAPQPMKEMTKILKREQNAQLERFHEKEMEDDEIKFILTTMTNDQLDNLLLQLQVHNLTEILQYLLKKKEQWTEISEQFICNSSEKLKKKQVRQLINSISNTFSADCKEDMTLTGLLKMN